MDMRYHPTTGYVPYYTPCGAFVAAGSPSPPLSVCSEPMLQLPIPDGRVGTPELQLKASKMQLLNKTMVDARRKKNLGRGQNLAPRVEPPDIRNFFQNIGPFSDHASDSGNGSMKGGSESPQFGYNPNPYFIPLSPCRWQQLDSPFQYCQPEQMPLGYMQVGAPPTLSCQLNQGQNNVRPPFLTLASPVSLAIKDPSVKTVNKHIRKDSDSLCSRESKTNYVEKNSKSKLKLSTLSKKKGLITSVKPNAFKKERTKHKLILRKQRKQIQQKNKSLHKTELCTHWMLTSNCTFKDKCYFAHGIRQLRKRVRPCNFKTKPCVACPQKEGQCLFGSRCNYCHPGEAIRRAVRSTYFDIDYYKRLKEEFKDNEYPFGIFV